MRLYSRSSFGSPFLTSNILLRVIPSFCAACPNALLASFVLISLFGLFRMVNNRLSGVRFVLLF